MTAAVHRGVIVGTTWEGLPSSLRIRFYEDAFVDATQIATRVKELAGDFASATGWLVLARQAIGDAPLHGLEDGATWEARTRCRVYRQAIDSEADAALDAAFNEEG